MHPYINANKIWASLFAAYGVVDFAEKENCDLIVIGTRRLDLFDMTILDQVLKPKASKDSGISNSMYSDYMGESYII